MQNKQHAFADAIADAMCDMCSETNKTVERCNKALAGNAVGKIPSELSALQRYQAARMGELVAELASLNADRGV